MDYGQLLAIYIAANKGLPMVEIPSASLIKDAGIQGDRYSLNLGAWSKNKRVIREVTFISIEAIQAVNAKYGVNFLPQDTRRNLLVTTPFHLHFLLDRHFTIGDVMFLGIKPADPCDRPSKLSGKPNFKTYFDQRAGIRAQVLNSGSINRLDLLIPQ